MRIIKSDGCCSSASIYMFKLLLLVFNFVFFGIGLALFVIGVYGLSTFQDFLPAAHGPVIYVAVVCIGLFMMALSSISLCCTSNRFVLYAYACIVFTLFVAMCLTSVAFMVYRSQVESQLMAGIERAIGDYPHKGWSIDTLQKNLKCCGSRNYTDWFSTVWAHGRQLVPKSCCIDTNNCTAPNVADEPKDIYTRGCFQLLYEIIEGNFVKVGALGFACSALLLVGSLISCVLARQIGASPYNSLH